MNEIKWMRINEWKWMNEMNENEWEWMEMNE